MQQNRKPIGSYEAAGLIAIGAFVLVGAIPFAAIWVAWGFGPMLAALVMLAVGIWLGRRLEA